MCAEQVLVLCLGLSDLGSDNATNIACCQCCQAESLLHAE